jgi:hypothetical protein
VGEQGAVPLPSESGGTPVFATTVLTQSIHPEITVIEPGQTAPAPPPGTTWGYVNPPIYGELDAQIALQMNGYDPYAGTIEPWTTAPTYYQCWLSPYTGDEICGYR